jgi:glycerol uptake facilitator-like aquaporin
MISLCFLHLSKFLIVVLWYFNDTSISSAPASTFVASSSTILISYRFIPSTTGINANPARNTNTRALAKKGKGKQKEET